MTRTLWVVPVVLSVVLLDACGSSPTASFYTLNPDAALVPMVPTKPVHVVVSPVTIPGLVDRPQFVTRVGNNQVALDEFARWGEPLKGNIARAIAGDLATLLGSDRVSVFDTGQDAADTWRVRVDVMRFDAVPGEAVTIEALWSVVPPGKSIPVVGKSLVRQQMDGHGNDALVSAGDRALGAVSREIAAAIQAGVAQ
ncbi:MAG: PqiC family protein [Paraburkholderia sp.]|uniref:PqiC family protein n=1 Tax=Paraburkholderia sp. TaxID=1926495 RepID=UPI003C5EA4D3